MARRPFKRIGLSLGLVLGSLGFFSWQLHHRQVSVLVRFAGGNAPVVAVTEADPDATNTLQLSGLEQKFKTVADKVSPSVVAISAAIQGVDTDHAVHTDELNPERLSQILDRTTRTVGTGFVVDSDGYILTNEHVIGDAEQLWVTTDDRKVYPAIVVASDPRGDLAVLKIPATNLKPVEFATAEPHRGQWVIALGNPYGLAEEGEMAMSVGLVSATDRSLPKLASKENRLYQNLIQTTAEINPGNSGGPLFDLDGHVIGLNTAVVLPQKNTFGIGFALPISGHLLAEVEDLKQGKEVAYGFVGVSVTTATPRERSAARLNKPLGVRIDSVETNSPAANGGLKDNDLIVKVGDRDVRDSDNFVRAVGDAPVDQPVHFGIYRDGRSMDLSIVLRRRPMPQVAVNRSNQRLRWNGLLLGPVPANWTTAKKASNGVMVIAIENAAKNKAKLQQGAIISSVGGRSIASLADLQQVLASLPAEQCTVETLHDRAVAAVDQSAAQPPRP